MKEKTNLKRMLIAPLADLKIESNIPIKTVATIHDVSQYSADGETMAMAFDDMRILECLTKFPDLFGLELITLIGVPGADYTAAFEQLVWSYDKVSYDTLVVEMTTLDRMEQLKAAEKPLKNPNQSSELPSRDDVLQAKIPSAIDWVKQPDGISED